MKFLNTKEVSKVIKSLSQDISVIDNYFDWLVYKNTKCKPKIRVESIESNRLTVKGDIKKIRTGTFFESSNRSFRVIACFEDQNILVVDFPDNVTVGESYQSFKTCNTISTNSLFKKLLSKKEFQFSIHFKGVIYDEDLLKK